MIRVALLRGINVGGKNKVAMASLKATFERLGFEDVTTYINSGNVVYRDDGTSPEAGTRAIEIAIREDFDLDIPTVLRSLPQMRTLLDALPDDWVNDRTATANAMFLWPEIDRPEILERIEVKPGIDDARYLPGALLWRVEKDVLTRSGMVRLARSPLYRQMTVRNVNTVRRIATIMEALAGDRT